MITHPPQAFKSALAQFATGVTIVTTLSPEGHDIGLTVNSFSAVSLSPPMILWSLDKKAASLSAFEASPYFTVHILSAKQLDLAMIFSQRGVDKFEGLSLRRGVGGVALLPECLAVFECRTVHRYEGGDHRIYVGEVAHFNASEAEPLLSFNRGLRQGFGGSESA